MLEITMRKKFIPREWQTVIMDYMLEHARCGVWAGMGTGKTVAVLTVYDLLYTAGYETKSMLVVAPLRVVNSVWPAEAKKWQHLKNVLVYPITGKAVEREAVVRRAIVDHRHGIDQPTVYAINYENLQWLTDFITTNKLPWPFGMVVADESTKLKSFRTKQGGKRPKALARVAHSLATRFIELTGTPAPNGLKDLWGQIWFLDAGQRLGGIYTAFVKRWFRKKFSGYGIEPMPHSQKEIESKLTDICISVDLADYIDIAEPVKNMIYVDLNADAMEKYKDMEKKMFVELKEIFDGREVIHEVEAFNAAAKTMKCLQLANGAGYIEGSNTKWVEIHDEKIQALDSIIEEAAGIPVLVAYHFKSDLARLRAAFPAGKFLDDKPQTELDWNAGKIPLLFAHPASAGHGLNLQDGGNILVFFSLNWNLEEHLQIIERIGPTRQMQSGHNRPVFVYHILARNTMDEEVLERLESKRETQDILLEAMKRKGIC